MTVTVQKEHPDPSVMRWRWTRHPRCVRLARCQLRKHLAARQAEDLTETGILLLSGLLTNAVRHAHVPPGREIETVFEITERALRVEVSDASNELPLLRHADPHADEGRGLALVATAATRWGVAARKVNEEYVIGKTVWFEIDREGRTPMQHIDGVGGEGDKLPGTPWTPPPNPPSPDGGTPPGDGTHRK